MGNSGKSVSRSYIAALDFLVPAEASASGTLAQSGSAPDDSKLSERKKLLKRRYDDAMKYLEEPGKAVAATPGQPPATKSKLSHYVDKQEAWAKAIEGFADAQDKQMSSSSYATDFMHILITTQNC